MKQMCSFFEQSRPFIPIWLVIFCLVFFKFGALAQNDEDLQQYGSFDVFIIDNTKAAGKMGLSGGQTMALEKKLDSLVIALGKQTNIAMYVCNGYNPEYRTDYKARAKWIIGLQDDNSKVGAQYQVDKNMLLQKIMEGDHFEAQTINVYILLQSDYINEQFGYGASDLAKFLNVLPSQIATLTGTTTSIVNVNVILPAIFGQTAGIEVVTRLQNISSFRINDNSYIKTNVQYYVAN